MSVVAAQPDAPEPLRLHAYECSSVPVSVQVSECSMPDAARELHLMFSPQRDGDAETQLRWVHHAYCEAVVSMGLDMSSAVFRRFFCSDVVNQAGVLDDFPFASRRSPDVPCAVSWVGQAPMPPGKVALWAYHMLDSGGALDRVHDASSVTLRRGALSHHWTAGLTCSEESRVDAQTRSVFENYMDYLVPHGMRLEENVIRTWLFVDDIDANYEAMVSARRALFAEHGMTRDTHYIASTGVEGKHADSATKVSMDAYAISGLQSEQIRFLAAPQHLSPTYVYGVTFERGTSVDYRDRRHIFLSGTASIDRHGRIVHEGDVELQLEHTLGNMDALLRTAGATLSDMAMCVAYLRDPSDLSVASRELRKRFPKTPMVIVHAPVCRPGWLIEMEAIAIVPASNPASPAF